MGALSPMHLILVLLVVLIVFGPGSSPRSARRLGGGSVSSEKQPTALRTRFEAKRASSRALGGASTRKPV